jgi:hypothetical protein
MKRLKKKLDKKKKVDSCREALRLPYFLNSRFTDGGEAVSLTCRPASLYPQEDSWYLVLLDAESTGGS